MKETRFAPNHLPAIAYGDIENEHVAPILRFSTTCCACAFLSLKNYHTLEDIREVIDSIKKDSNSRKFSPAKRDGGEQSLLCVISPGEDLLEINLKKLNFVLISDKMKRRRGYPDPNWLKLYLLTF